MPRAPEPDQAWIASAIQRPERLAADPSVVAGCERFIAKGRLSPVEQLEIYREQFFLRHVGALVEDFPATRWLVGEGAFHDLAVRYLGAHPPTSFTLRDLGDRFAAFVRGASDLPNHALALDMAAFEWALVEVFDAASAPPLDAARLSEVPADAWPGAVLRLHPTLRVVLIGHPVHRIREEILEGGSPALPAAEPMGLALFRDGLQLRREELSPGAFALLENLARGTPLAEACSAAADRLPPTAREAFSGEVAQAFARFTGLGLVVGLELP